MNLFNRNNSPTLLGLSLDGSRLDGVLLHRTNGAVKIVKTFTATLTLDLLNNDPELVGQEIRNHLDAAGINERRCVLCVPLAWAMTLTAPLPDLPPADIAGYLQIEAERNFSLDPTQLLIAHSRYGWSGGAHYATQTAMPLNHLARLEQTLAAAQLRPLSFSPGIALLQPASTETSIGVVALAINGSGVDLQITAVGGVVALRALEAAGETEGGERELDGDFIARELRITLGQLPTDVRASLRCLRVFGATEAARELTEELSPVALSLGLTVEQVTRYSANELGVQVPADAGVSAALSLAVRHLAGQRAALDFLPPKVSAWQQLSARYSSRKLVWSGATAGAVAAVVLGMFIFQQWQLSVLETQWGGMRADVEELDDLQQRIRRFRPWFDESLVSLTLLRKITEAFPEDGTVTAKTLEIRNLSTVTCTGATRDNAALLKTLERLRASREISDVRVDSIRGKSPMQFTFNFHWDEKGRP